MKWHLLGYREFFCEKLLKMLTNIYSVTLESPGRLYRQQGLKSPSYLWGTQPSQGSWVFHTSATRLSISPDTKPKVSQLLIIRLFWPNAKHSTRISKHSKNSTNYHPSVTLEDKDSWWRYRALLNGKHNTQSQRSFPALSNNIPM